MEIFRFILGFLLSILIIQGNAQFETSPALEEITDSTTLVLLEPSRTVTDLDIPTSGLDLQTSSAPQSDALPFTNIPAVTSDTPFEPTSTPAELETSFNVALTSSTRLSSLDLDQGSVSESTLSDSLSTLQLSRTDSVVDSSPSNSFVSSGSEKSVSSSSVSELFIQNVESSSRSQVSLSQLPEQYMSTFVLLEQSTEQVASSSVSQDQAASSSVSQDQAASSSVSQDQAASTSVSQNQIVSSSFFEGQITSSAALQEQITSSSVLQEQITSSSVLQDQITSSSVLQEKISSSFVLEEQISSSSVLQDQITSSSVLQEKISSSFVLEEQISSSSVLQEQKTSSSVLQKQISSSFVLEEQISSSSVLQEQITSSSVLQKQISSSSVLIEQIASSSVLQEQIASSSVLQEQISSSSVLIEQITPSSVLQEQITSSSVLQEQISSSSVLIEQITPSSVLQEQITSSSVLQEQISSSSVLIEQITPSSVLQEQITSSSVLQEQISSSFVLQEQISSSSVLQQQISSSSSSVLQTTGQIPPSSYPPVQPSEDSVSPEQASSSAPVSLTFLSSSQSELPSASVFSTSTASSSTLIQASTSDGVDILDSSSVVSVTSDTVPEQSVISTSEIQINPTSVSSLDDVTSVVALSEGSLKIQSTRLSTSSAALQEISESSYVPFEASSVPIDASLPSYDQTVSNTFRTTSIDFTESRKLTNTISPMQSSEEMSSPVSVNVDSVSFVSNNVQSSSQTIMPSQIPENILQTSAQIFETSADSPTVSISLSVATSSKLYDGSFLSTSVSAPALSVSEDNVVPSSYASLQFSTLPPEMSSSSASVAEDVTSFLSELQSKESSSYTDQSRTTLLFDASSALSTSGLTSEILHTSENSLHFPTQTETPSIATIASTNSLSSEQLSQTSANFGSQSDTVPSLSSSESILASSFPQEINLGTNSVRSTLEIQSSGISYQTYASSGNVQRILATTASQQLTDINSESLFSFESSDASTTGGAFTTAVVLESSSHQSDIILTYTLSLTAPNTGSASSSDAAAVSDASIQESSFTETLIPSLSILSTVVSNTESVQPAFQTPYPTDSVVFSVVSVESSSIQLASISFPAHETNVIFTSETLSSLETAASNFFPTQFSSALDVASTSSGVSGSQSSSIDSVSSLYQFSSILNLDSTSLGSSTIDVLGTVSESSFQTNLVSRQGSEFLSSSQELLSSSQSVISVVPSFSEISSTVPKTQLSSSPQWSGSSEVAFTGFTLQSDSVTTSTAESVLGTIEPSTSGSELQSIASSPLLPIIIGSGRATETESFGTSTSGSFYESQSVQTNLISSQLLSSTNDIPGSRLSDSSLLLPSGLDLSTGFPFSTAFSTPSLIFPNPSISTANSESVPASFTFSTVLQSSTAPIVILPTFEQSSAISSFDISLMKPSSSLFGTQSFSGFSDIVSSNLASMSYPGASLMASESVSSIEPVIPVISLTESQTTLFGDSLPTELLSMTATGSQSFTVSTSVVYDFSSVSSSSEGNSTSIDVTRPSSLLFSQLPIPTGSTAFLVSSSDLSTNSSIGGIVFPTFSGSSASVIFPSGSDIFLTTTGSLIASDVSSASRGFVPVPTLSLGSLSDSSVIPLVTESSNGLPSQGPFESRTNLPSLSLFDTSTILPTQGPFETLTNLPLQSLFDTSTFLPSLGPFETSTNLPSQGPFETRTNLPSLSSFDTSTILPSQGPFETSTNLPSLSLFDTNTMLPTQGPFETRTNLPSQSLFDTSLSLPSQGPFETSTNLPSQGPFETSTNLLSLSSFDRSTILPSQGPFETSTNLASQSLFDTSTILPFPSPFETSSNLPSLSLFETSTILPTQGPFETRTNLPSQSQFDTSLSLPSQGPFETSTNLPSQGPFETSTNLPSQGPFETSTNLLSLSSFDTSTILPSQGPFETRTNLPSQSQFDTSLFLPSQGPFETSTNLPSQGPFETSTNLLSLSSFDTSTFLPSQGPFETSTNLPSQSLFDTSTFSPSQGPFETSTNLPSQSLFDTSTFSPSQGPFETSTNLPSLSSFGTSTNLPSQSSFLTSGILQTESLSDTSFSLPSPSLYPSSSFLPVSPTRILSSLSGISSQEYTDISSLFTRSYISAPSALTSLISTTGSPPFVSSSSIAPSGASSETFGSLSSEFMESNIASSSESTSVIILLPSSKLSDMSSVIFQTTGTVSDSSLFGTTTSFTDISIDSSQFSAASSVPVTVLPSPSSMVSESISISGVTSLESRSPVDSSLQPDTTTLVPTDILSTPISSDTILSPSSSVIISASDTNVIFSSSVSMVIVSYSQTDISSRVSVDTSTPTDVVTTVVSSSSEPTPSSVTELSSSLTPTPTSSSSATPSSSVLPSPPTTTPSLNTSDALKEFWVNTVIKVRQSEDVSSDAFKEKMEGRLAGVYGEAFAREEMINNGTYQPLKRRKRYATSPDGNIKLQVVNVERDTTSNNVKLTYLAEKDGKMIPSDKMVHTLELLDHQEVALGLGYVVDTKAEPYVPVPVQPPEEDKKLWIIAAVLGPIALIILIWIIICIACRCCCNRKTTADAEEPHLMKVRRDGAQVESEASGAPPDYPPEQGSKRSSSAGLIKASGKKMSYEVNPDPDEEATLYPEVKKLVDVARTNRKKKHPLSSPRSEANDSMTYVSEDDRYATPARRKGTKQNNIPREADDSSSQIDNSLEPRPKPLPIPRHSRPLHSEPPASAQEEEELLERAEMERIKNKQRLREQRKRERFGNTDPPQSGDHEVRQVYKKAQKEIDAVLGSPDQDGNLPDVFMHKPKKRSTRHKKDPQEGHTNEAFTEDEQEGSSQSGESLDEAKRRMHKLLDDAFSLISSSRSSIGNKVTPVSSPTKLSYTSLSESRKKDDASEVTPRANGSVPKESKESKQPAEEEKKHTPLYFNPTYTGQEEGSPRLETWSPYRAADEVALISLPQTQTVMDKTPTQERLQTTTFSESYPTSMRDSYYATEPAKPIVIRTKDLDIDPQGTTNSKPSQPKHQTVNGIGTGMGKSGLPNGDTSYPGMTGYEDIPLHSFGSKSHTQDSVKENGGVNGGLHGGLNGGPHKPPTKTWAGQDEVDVVSSLEPGASPRPFIRSLREELEHLSTRIGEPGNTDSHGNALA
ncbi:uncharacterized threonine-rich GPI-anchored glycoprotein PJ4664.02-like isoform X2 [Haliotis rufescens]|uniref:uncharacterized threonine-rich GPI-anchored glycoprotein PJ4664.02-like isoform X2 n=1 Tax=Haliotis rufescens TaxID=6454 RepID=UPI00201EDA16|nr:uncharacterized threonine-rich GPI-anchored glycoprotein PJ4664.02-like isoform X2 [Haliotis rufescens]